MNICILAGHFIPTDVTDNITDNVTDNVVNNIVNGLVNHIVNNSTILAELSIGIVQE